MGFRFLHTADVHLDSPLRGLSPRDEDAAVVERIRRASREAFERLIARAVEEAVDFVIIAGDLYDGDWKDANTGHFFNRQMITLREAGIPVYLLHGNHDAVNRMTRTLTPPENVHVFPAKTATSAYLRDIRVALHGQSFDRRDVSDNLARNYPAPEPGYFNIGILHTCAEDTGPHGRYAPCTLEDLRSKGYQYWALGHVHQHQVLHEDPPILFPGNLQGRHIRETGPKGALLVTVDDDGAIDWETVHTDVVRWDRLEVDLSEAETWEDLEDRVRERAARASDDDDLLRVWRVRLTGTTTLHRALHRSSEDRRETVHNAVRLATAGRAWVEKIEPATRAPRSTSEAETDDAAQAWRDPLEALLREAHDNPDLQARLLGDLEKLTRKMPRDVVADSDLLQAVSEGRAGEVLDRTEEFLLAHLPSGDETTGAD